MKVAIVAPSPVPFAPGGAEAVWAGLYRELAENTPHDVELIKVPTLETSLPEVMAGYQQFAELDLTHFDLVISGKYPAWMVRHPNHVIYLLHPLRGLYDSYGAFKLPLTEASDEPAIRRLLSTAHSLESVDELPSLFRFWRTALEELGPDHPAFGFPGPLARILVRAMDRVALQPGTVARHYAISRTVASRPDYFPSGVTAKVVYPPSDLQGLHSEPGEFFFTASRHDAPKRLDLLIRAMAHYRGERRLLIGGRGPDSGRLEALAADDPRIEFVGRLSPADLVDHYARSLGVPFLPYDEDLGLITLEAMAAGKPVLTTRDSGGPTEFVIPGRNGIIVEPTPQDLGAGLTRLEQLAGTAQVGEAARRTVADITWKRLAAELLGMTRPIRRHVRTGRPRLIVTSTFPIWPPKGGGQLRAYHLYGALSRRFDIDLVCLANPFVAPSERQLAPGFSETVVPRSLDHHEQEVQISTGAGFPVTDIVAGRLISRTPAYLSALSQAAKGADAVLLADPYLNPAILMIDAQLPIIYDAFNCEYLLKSQLLPDTPLGDELRQEVHDVESAACADAQLILTVSNEDATSLRSCYGTPAEKFLLVPNGVDLDSVPFTPMAQRRQNRDRWLSALQARDKGAGLTRLATFIGSWHPPNNDAGRAIVEMAPELPEVGFLLIGGHCATLQGRRLPPNVFLLGMVSDGVKQTVLRSADIALAPLASGSGTNLKVVEYLAAGIPLVSTAVGMRGLAVDRSSVRIAAVADFPGAIRAELEAADSALIRTERARAEVEQSYGWRALGALATAHIEGLLRLAPQAA